MRSAVSNRVRPALKFPNGPRSDGEGTDATPLHRAGFAPAAAWELDLVVEAGPDAGARLALSSARPSKMLVGQSASCDFRLRERTVSRRHASIDASEWPVVVRDLGSTNGTFVNGVAVVEAGLSGAETLRLGDALLRVARRGAAAPEAAPSGRWRPAGGLEALGRMIGASDAMRIVYAICERLADGEEPVLVEGEAGTGKALLARALHEMGRRALRPFVVLDCALGTAETEQRQRDRGDGFEHLFSRAAGGTLLLDTVGALEPSLQRPLARALAGGPVGARIVATSRFDLASLVREGRFREDLFACVSVARVELPPLRERRGDVLHLARHFWLEEGGDERAFPAEVLAQTEAHPWPGNVRELRELVARLRMEGVVAAGGEGGDGATASLDRVVGEILRADVSYSEARRRLLVEFEQRYVEQMLDAHHGNVTRAAAASGLARRNFQLIRARRRDES
jgi:DNA-binding NtrC family response regulator